MSEITVTLPDGSTKSVADGATVRDVAAAISPRLASAAFAGAVDGKLVDLSHQLHRDAAVRVITDKSPEGLHVYRHSTAHLLAAAVTALFPGAQCGIGPATEEGFFYDFVVDRPFVPEDLAAIEKKMKELAAADLVYERQMWPRDQAREFFRKRGETLKVQLIDEKTEGQSEVSVYTIKDPDTFVDFCVGPHVPSSGRLKGFRLLSTSNAYWKGDAKNAPMQRIYGTAFFSDKELDAYLTQIEEAKKRDHRKVGKELGLFMFHPWAPGAAFWLDKGDDALPHARGLHARGALPRRLRRGAHAAHLQQGAVGDLRALAALPPEHVPRRVRARADGREGHELPRAHARLRQRSAQLPRSADSLSRADAAPPQRSLGRALGPDARPSVLPGRRALLRDGGSDRLGGRVAAEARAARLHGLRPRPTRRSCRRGRRSSSAKSPRGIAPSRRSKTALEGAGQAYTINEGDGAFYGPKIDFDITDALGRKWQCATIQLDYQMPERFDLKYVGADNAEHRPVVIHRAIFGSFERFIALLIEHYAGAFPLWLAPVQARLLPIADRHLDYARTTKTALEAAGLRVELDDRQEKIGYKIREAQLQKIPYMLVIGDREAAEGTVAVRTRAGGDQGARPAAEFTAAATAEVRTRRT